MKTKIIMWSALTTAFLIAAMQIHANLITVSFTATIENSPFSTPGYTVGSVITGLYVYDPAAGPVDNGFNFTDYTMQGMHLLFGATAYQAGSGRLSLFHALPILVSPPPTDSYDLLGFSLVGPSVEGFLPGWSELNMIDSANSAYAALTTPYPISLPDPALFDIKRLEIVFLQAPAGIDARIDTITMGQITTVPDGGAFWLFGGICCLMALARHGLGRTTRTVDIHRPYQAHRRTMSLRWCSKCVRQPR